MTIVDTALMIATVAHQAVGQKRKYTGEDYITHPIAVSKIVMQYTDCDYTIAAAEAKNKNSLLKMGRKADLRMIAGTKRLEANKGDSKANILQAKAISAKATSELLSQPLVVQESEVIKVTAATANRLHVVLSALEIKPREVV